MTNETLLISILLAPGVLFLSLSALWLLGWSPREKGVSFLTRLCYSYTTAGTAWLFFKMRSSGNHPLRISLGEWFEAGEYEFPLVLLADELTLPMVGMTSVLVGLIGFFSASYLHREAGFFRFFQLLHLFSFGSLLTFTAGSFDLLTAGWELVGIASVLLIGFFSYRREPVRNAVRVFAAYRISDLGLLLVLFVFHYQTGSAVFSNLFMGEWPNQTVNMTASTALLAGFLLLCAAAGKSAQIPFSGWLPRAMEGPTPSSAIFYGAISVHAGAYLLLRASPVIAASWLASGAVIGIGLLTAALATLAHRTSTDAKTGLAYASMSQVGIVFVEIGFGLQWLALIHIIGHAVVRTTQFLRAPSMLHDYHRVHSAAGGHLGKTGRHAERFLPKRLQAGLYRFSLEFGSYDAILERYITGPVMRLAHWLLGFEPGPHQKRPAPTPPPADLPPRSPVASTPESA